LSFLPLPRAAGDVIRSSDMNLVIAALKLIAPNIVTKTGDYLATLDDMVILVDDTGDDVIITLPVATTSGKTYLIAKTHSSANHVTITPNGADEIDGHTGMQLDTQFDKLLLMADGVSNWAIVSSIGTPH
jgi:hypothetical protein